jgi:glycosyltransferase involved in cell wall biosynthesis
MASWTLSGMRRAHTVFHSTDAVRHELLTSRLVTEDRLVHAPYGICVEFQPASGAYDEDVRRRFGGGYLLHVGSCIPRKNTEFLLQIHAALKKRNPLARLVQVGGTWSTEEQEVIHRERLEASVHQLRGVSRDELAAIYRQAAVVLLPSKAEGFGLPVIEALACGAQVIASDLPVLKEVGGDVVIYRQVGDLAGWCEAIAEEAGKPRNTFSVAARADRAAQFSWAEHARIIATRYLELERQAADRSRSW